MERTRPTVRVEKLTGPLNW